MAMTQAGDEDAADSVEVALAFDVQ